jgi:hypothetical protein
MNEEYLWNKTGEPDPEVQELEEILGVLRYQPRKLVLPEDLPIARRRSYYPLLAIAATFAFAILAAGLWFSLRSTNTPASKTANKTAAPVPPVPVATPTKIDDAPIAANGDGIEKATPQKRQRQRQYTVANPAIAAQKQREREEALAAKEQLMIALRLASEKLNQAQRRTQVPSTPNPNRNQHRVG